MESDQTPRRRRHRRAFAVNGWTVRTLREIRGWTLAELSQRSGVSVPHISAVERNARGARPETIRLLAAALSVPDAALQSPVNDEGGR